MLPYYSNFKDYFKILQIDPEAEQEVISAAYKALMKKYHPDKNCNNENDYVKEINEAYEILSDANKREEYKKKYKELILENQKIPYLLIDRIKRKEEELKRKEVHIKIKEKILNHMNMCYDENISSLEKLKKFINDFLDSKPSKEKDIFQKINEFDNKEDIIKYILSSKLSLSKELIIYEFILDNKLEYFKNKISPAFKFRALYPKIFDYLYEFEVKDYNSKIEIIINSLSFDTLKSETEIFVKIIKLIPKIFDKSKVVDFLRKFENRIEKIIKKESKEYYELISLFYNTINDLDISEEFNKKILKKIKTYLLNLSLS